MQKILTGAHRLSRALVWLGGTLLIGSAALVTVEVVIRKLFNVSLGGADEISGYAFGVATALALSFALLERAHIRVDAFYALFPRWLRIASDLLGAVLLTGFMLVVTVMATQLVADTLQHGSRSITPLRTPLIIPQAAWLLGWIFAVCCGALLIAGALYRLVRRDHRGASRLIGIKSVSELIDDERV